jgi:hypothetical protein
MRRASREDARRRGKTTIDRNPRGDIAALLLREYPLEAAEVELGNISSRTRSSSRLKIRREN